MGCKNKFLKCVIWGAIALAMVSGVATSSVFAGGILPPATIIPAPIIIGGTSTATNTAIQGVQYGGTGATTAAAARTALGVPAGSGTSTGTNTGDVAIGTFGSTPNANGASISGQVLTLQPAGTSNPGLVTLTQVASGSTWLSPISVPYMLDDSLVAPPGSCVVETAYIAAATSGAWTAGHIYECLTTGPVTWTDVGLVSVGTRVGINFSGVGTAAGSFAGMSKHIMEVTGGTPGAYTFTETVPAAGYQVFVDGMPNSVGIDYKHTYWYNAGTSIWVDVQGGATSNPVAGNGLQYAGNTLEINTGITVDKTTGQTLINKDIAPLTASYSAAGTTQGTATPISAADSYITGGAGGGAILTAPPAVGVTRWIDADMGSGIVTIYPPVGSTIEGFGVNGGMQIPNGSDVILKAETATLWIITGGRIMAMQPITKAVMLSLDPAKIPVGTAKFLVTDYPGGQATVVSNGTKWITVGYNPSYVTEASPGTSNQTTFNDASIVKSISFPAGLLQAGDFLAVTSVLTKQNSTNAESINAYLGTTGTISGGDTLITPPGTATGAVGTTALNNPITFAQFVVIDDTHIAIISHGGGGSFQLTQATRIVTLPFSLSGNTVILSLAVKQDTSNATTTTNAQTFINFIKKV